MKLFNKLLDLLMMLPLCVFLTYHTGIVILGYGPDFNRTEHLIAYGILFLSGQIGSYSSKECCES